METDWSRSMLSRSFRFAIDWIGGHWIRDVVLLGLVLAAVSQLDFPNSWPWYLEAVVVLFLSVVLSVALVFVVVVLTDPARRLSAIHTLLLSTGVGQSGNGYMNLLDKFIKQLEGFQERAGGEEDPQALLADYIAFHNVAFQALEVYGTDRAWVLGPFTKQGGLDLVKRLERSREALETLRAMGSPPSDRDQGRS